jgi:hypothetical protein
VDSLGEGDCGAFFELFSEGLLLTRFFYGLVHDLDILPQSSELQRPLYAGGHDPRIHHMLVLLLFRLKHITRIYILFHHFLGVQQFLVVVIEPRSQTADEVVLRFLVLGLRFSSGDKEMCLLFFFFKVVEFQSLKHKF